MLRQSLINRTKDKAVEFKWRSREVSRLEGLSDTVFGFAITLLIVSLEVPRTSGELLQTMRGFFAFVLTFGVLFSLWHKQFIFFRRYGLEDTTTVLLNGALLLVVLFFVFPFKFLANVLVNRVLGFSNMVTLANGQTQRAILPEHWPALFGIYGFGLAAVFAVFALMYRHAESKRDALELTPAEIYDTRDTMRLYFCNATLGVVVGANGLITGFRTQTSGDTVLAAVFGIIELAAIVFVMRFRMTRQKRRANYMNGLTPSPASDQLPAHAN